MKNNKILHKNFITKSLLTFFQKQGKYNIPKNLLLKFAYNLNKNKISIANILELIIYESVLPFTLIYIDHLDKYKFFTLIYEKSILLIFKLLFKFIKKNHKESFNLNFKYKIMNYFKHADSLSEYNDKMLELLTDDSPFTSIIYNSYKKNIKMKSSHLIAKKILKTNYRFTPAIVNQKYLKIKKFKFTKYNIKFIYFMLKKLYVKKQTFYKKYDYEFNNCIQLQSEFKYI